MKLFKTSLISHIDSLTIQNEPITSIELMKRASRIFYNEAKKIISVNSPVYVFAGPGNNGGDAFFIAQYLLRDDYDVTVFFCKHGVKVSPDCEEARELFCHQYVRHFNNVTNITDLPAMNKNGFIVDGLFGSGLNRPLSGFFADVVKAINNSKTTVLSIDIPSGLMGEDNGNNIPEHIVQAKYTFTFQFPKLSFFFPENDEYVGKWTVLDIGLHPDAIQNTETNYHIIDDEFVKKHLKERKKFSHKGTYGHALLIGGSYGKIGAAILASKACLRAGVGLLTTHVPQCGYEIMQISVPEAMISVDADEKVFSGDIDISGYSNIGIGIGLGQAEKTVKSLEKIMKKLNSPAVFDADALNILGSNRNLFKYLPENSILTPHPKEWERLTIRTKNSYENLKTIAIFASQHHVYILLKGANTVIVCPDGNCWFNVTGNPGMATGGSGDVLCGIILGLLAQNYSPFEAAALGVYFHGKAGDAAALKHSMPGMIAGDIIEELKIETK